MLLFKLLNKWPLKHASIPTQTSNSWLCRKMVPLMAFYFLNAAYSDPAFMSAEDEADPMVIVKLDISNDFGSLCARLVLDVLSGKASRDYACGIKVDEEFETAVHELRAYFGFFKLARTCETILRYYSYDGATNYVRCKK